MKKLFALLLVVIMVLSLVACKKPVDPTTTTTGGDDSTTGTQTNEKPYKGKTITIWGETAEKWTTFESFKADHNYVRKAAMLEWAEANEVTLEWKGSYNQNAVLAAINAGQKPDLVLRGSGAFPAISNYGITAGFTDEEYAKISEAIGKNNSYLLELTKYNGQSHGVIYPWHGNWMLYFNKTMFEQYDVKSPQEYFMEGTWNWTNFQKCMEEMTRDIDGDGKTDTYGLNTYALTRFAPQTKIDDKGKLLNILDDPISWDYMNFRYTQGTVKGTIMSSSDKITTLVTMPRYAMQISYNESYNYMYQYYTLSNGDEIRTVPVPYWDGGDKGTWYPEAVVGAAFCLLSSCDEREAVVDMITYALKCGMKYVADMSMGAITCDYPGVAGTCEVSKTYKEKAAQLIKDREEEIKTNGYDKELAKAIAEYYASEKITKYETNPSFANVTNLGDWADIAKKPPATFIAENREKYDAQLKTYNDLYVYY